MQNCCNSKIKLSKYQKEVLYFIHSNACFQNDNSNYGYVRINNKTLTILYKLGLITSNNNESIGSDKFGNITYMLTKLGESCL